MYCSAFQAIGQSGITTIKKASVKPGQCQGECDFVGRFLSHGAFDQRNHPIEKGLTGMRRDFHHDSIRYNPRPTGDAGTIAASFANDWCRLAGDRRFVDRGDAFDDLAVARYHLTRSYHDAIAWPEIGREHFLYGIRPFRRYAGVSLRVLRSDSACALPRASASAVAKLANSTVRNSHASSAMKYVIGT